MGSAGALPRRLPHSAIGVGRTGWLDGDPYIVTKLSNHPLDAKAVHLIAKSEQAAS